jgi:hypothetical protein
LEAKSPEPGIEEEFTWNDQKEDGDEEEDVDDEDEEVVDYGRLIV